MFLEQKINQMLSENKSIKVALIGAGKFGSMFLSQIPSTRGIKVSKICDLNIEKAKQSCLDVGWSEDLISNTVFSESAKDTIKSDDVDVVVEATGSPGSGIVHARECFKYGSKWFS